MNNPVLYAAAYVLLMGQPPQAVPSTVTATTLCQLPCPPAQNCDRMGRPLPPGHVSVRWKGPTTAPHDMEDNPDARRGHHWRHHHHRRRR